MTRRLRRPLSMIALLLTLIEGARGGGAWTQRSDDYYIKIDATWTSGDQEFDFNGERRLLFPDTSAARHGTFGMTELGFYVELGLSDRITAIAATQYKVAVREARLVRAERDTAISSSGLSDLWLGGRVALMNRESPVALSTTVSIKVPTGSPLQEMPLGSGQVDYEIGADIGVSYKAGSVGWGWAEGGIAFRMRNGAADEVVYSAGTGLDVGSGITLMSRFEGIASRADFDGAAIDPDRVATWARLNGNSSYHRLVVDLIYRSSSTLQISLGYRALLSGRNIVDADGVAIGLAWTRP